MAEWLFFPVVAVLACMLLLFPTGTLAVAALAPGRGAELPGHRAADDRLHPGAPAGGPPGPRRYLAHVPEPVRRSGRRDVPLPGPDRQLQFPDLAVRAVPRGGSAVAGAALPGGRRRAAAPDQLGRAGRRRASPWSSWWRSLASWPTTASSRPSPAPPMPRPPSSACSGFPAAITVGILKYRLYEIDVIINRAVVYGLVSAGLTAVYAGIVLGIGTLAGQQGSPLLTIAAAVAVALLFQPARQRARRVANRLVYGRAGHALPGAVRLRRRHGRAAGLRQGGGQDGDRPGQRHRRHPGGGLDPGRARAAPGGDLAARILPARPPSRSPTAAQLPAFEAASRAVAVRHGDELLGALALHKPRNEPLTQAEDKLLAAPGLPGGTGLPQRPAHRGAAGHDRGTEGLAAAAGGGAGRGAARRSSATCTTGRSSSSSRSPSSLACWKSPPTTPPRSGS